MRYTSRQQQRAQDCGGKVLAGDCAQFAAVHDLKRGCMLSASSIAPAALLSVTACISAAMRYVSVWRRVKRYRGTTNGAIVTVHASAQRSCF